MTILVTGAAGFIGMHVAQALLARGDRVLGIDNMNSYYSVALKRARLEQLGAHTEFSFLEGDVAASGLLDSILADARIDRVVHLAAQAGVRYSLENPEAYIQSNIVGHFRMLEACRQADGRIRHFVYASSSSVYGGNKDVPFSIDQKIDKPISLYAATKASDELMSHAYAHLYGLPMTALRFFTVYGPWGRPDMAPWLFTEAILRGQPIRIFNHGRSRRDFTYIDDIVAGVLAALDHPPRPQNGSAPIAIYNLGNDRPVALMDFIAAIEHVAGRPAIKEFHDAQPGDVEETWADIAAARQDLGFDPHIEVKEGMARFVDWFRTNIKPTL